MYVFLNKPVFHPRDRSLHGLTARTIKQRTTGALSFMFKIDEFCRLCFHIIHVLSFRPNPVSFFS
ncbi:hypothetical protein Hanom_Chr17g01525911 [Helianthus anomalus]